MQKKQQNTRAHNTQKRISLPGTFFIFKCCFFSCLLCFINESCYFGEVTIQSRDSQCKTNAAKGNFWIARQLFSVVCSNLRRNDNFKLFVCDSVHRTGWQLHKCHIKACTKLNKQNITQNNTTKDKQTQKKTWKNAKPNKKSKKKRRKQTRWQFDTRQKKVNRSAHENKIWC